ncbi:MAG: DedA family protein, partial [Clostridia bacterium]
WLLAKYGSYALVISYFFPVVRHVIPYLVGIGKMSFRRYAFFSYGAGLIWTLLFFIVGYLFGDHVEEIGKLAYSYGLYVLAAVAGIGLVVWVVRCSMGKRQQQEREM